MTANKHRGEVAMVGIDGAEIILRPTMAAIIAWEAKTGRTTIELAVAGSERALRAVDAAAAVTAAADAAGNPIPDEAMSALIESNGLAHILGPAIALLSNALTGGTADDPGEPLATAGNP